MWWCDGEEGNQLLRNMLSNGCRAACFEITIFNKIMLWKILIMAKFAN